MENHTEYTKTQFQERFPKTSEVIKCIDELRKVDLTEISDEDLKEKIDNCFNIIPFTSGTIKAGTELFRARKNIGKKPFILVKDIYAPPSDNIKHYGRANKPGERVFYCASNYRLASIEVLQDFKSTVDPMRQIGYLTVGVWRAKYDINVTTIIYNQKLHSIREDILKAYNDTQKMIREGGELNDDIQSANEMILEYFAEEFIKDTIIDESDYKVSNYYMSSLGDANQFLAPEYSSQKFDGVNYPSIAMRYNGDNQAFFIDSADTKLEIVNAIQVLCSSFNFETGDFISGIMHEAESIIDGKITWKQEPYKP